MPLVLWMGSARVCDKGCLDEVTLLVLSLQKSQSSLVGETLGERILVPVGGSIFRQIRIVQRKPLTASAIFQVPTSKTHNQPYISTAYCGVAYLGVILD